ncbi:MAG: tetratricopeptide repeat protein [Elusimicrobia bacterium]|nr:tetratricopeptide repeat protein [Elusimicrobiota bacterium]
MKRPLHRAALLLLLAMPVFAGEPDPSIVTTDPNAISPEMDHWLMKGIDDIYRMRFDDAEADARKVIALNPAHPHGYMGLAGVAWTRYVYESDQSDPSLLVPFEKASNEAIAVAQRWLKAHPKDGEAYFCMGAADGIASRLAIIRHEWVKGYWRGRDAIKTTRQAVKVDPHLWDAYLGLGMYDYYSEVLSRSIGVLARIVIRGDRLKGIQTLEMVAAKGHYSANNAKILLVEIYTEDPYGAKDPAHAVEIMKDLRAQYPDSAMMHSAQLVAMHEAHLYPRVVDGARDYIARVKSGKYNSIEGGKGWVALGCGLWNLGRKDEALAAFREAQKVKYKGGLSRWAAWAFVRAANLEDVMGRREDAKRDYKFVLSLPDTWGFYALAKAGASRPYAKPGSGPIPPP